VLSVARYGRDGKMNGSALDAAFATGIDAIKRLQSANRWPMRTITSLTRQATEIVWSR